MNSIQEWRLKSNEANFHWENLKFVWGSGQIPIDPKIKNFVKGRLGKIQDAIVASLSQGNPKIRSFRDVPPEMRDRFAQAIVAATLELFFSSLDPAATGAPATFNQQQLGKYTQSQPLPQDEPKTPVVSGQ